MNHKPDNLSAMEIASSQFVDTVDMFSKPSMMGSEDVISKPRELRPRVKSSGSKECPAHKIYV